jgi:hypothetical protein
MLDMRKSDLTCPDCKAGYRRIELISKKGFRDEFRYLVCNHVLEVFEGCTEVAIRLTVQPSHIFRDRNLSIKKWPLGRLFCGVLRLRDLRQ